MMGVATIEYFIFLIFAIGVYYCIPRRNQWIALLVFSIIFFILNSSIYTGVYLLITIFSVYETANRIEIFTRNNQPKRAKRELVVSLCLNLGMLFVLKYGNFIIDNINVILNTFSIDYSISNINFVLPIGISFYTFTAIGYLLDCYWGVAKSEKNPLKTALFIGYFPLLTSGPITKQSEMSSQLYKGYEFNWKNVTFGLQRVLWGLFKKLVLSAKLAIVVNTIYADTVFYDGLYVWFAAGLFMIQLYTDFSGCMDIIIGTSECFGIVLPENFKNPFFARSVQEFWQRWHITLGAWMRDYFMYPLLKSNAWAKLNSFTKKRFSKKTAKKISTYLAMLCVWLVIGLWHGAEWKYILGQGLWFYSCIVLGQIFEPKWKKLHQKFNIKTTTFSYHLFQSIRVFILVSIGNMFFRLNSIKDVFITIKNGLGNCNPWIFIDGSMYNLGLSEKEVRYTIFFLLISLVVAILQEKTSIRERIYEQNIVYRWLIYFALIFIIIIFGSYGPGYDAQSFIYQGF